MYKFLYETDEPVNPDLVIFSDTEVLGDKVQGALYIEENAPTYYYNMSQLNSTRLVPIEIITVTDPDYPGEKETVNESYIVVLTEYFHNLDGICTFTIAPEKPENIIGVVWGYTNTPCPRKPYDVFPPSLLIFSHPVTAEQAKKLVAETALNVKLINSLKR